MKKICAWCKKVTKDGPEEKATHGICPDCRKGLNKKIQALRSGAERKDDATDSIPARDQTKAVD
jgi:hypothetical protein